MHSIPKISTLNEAIDVHTFSCSLQKLLPVDKLKTWRDFLELDPASVMEPGKFGLKTWREFIDKKKSLFKFVKEKGIVGYEKVNNWDWEQKSVCFFHWNSPSLSPDACSCLSALGVIHIGELISLTKDDLRKECSAGKIIWHEIQECQKYIFSDISSGKLQDKLEDLLVRNESEKDKGPDSRESTGLPNRQDVIQKDTAFEYGCFNLPPALVVSARVRSCLNRLKVVTWDQLACLSEQAVMETPNAGRRTWQEVQSFQVKYRHAIQNQKVVEDTSETGCNSPCNENVTSVNGLTDEGSFEEYFKKRLCAFMTIRNTDIIALTWGLESGERATLQEIGEEIGLTRERVRQIIVRAEALIKKYIKMDAFAELVSLVEVLVNEAGGLLRIDTLAANLQMKTRWKTPPKHLPLYKLLSLDKKWIVDIENGHVRLRNAPCVKCSDVRRYLQDLFNNETHAIHAQDAGCRVANFCRDTCKRDLLVPQHFGPDIVKLWAGRCKNIRVYNDELLDSHYWTLRHERKIVKVVHAALAEIGTPTYYKDLAEFIRTHNDNHQDISDKNIHACLTSHPKMFKIAQRGTYALIHWKTKAYLSHGDAIIRLLQEKGPLTVGQITGILTREEEFKAANIIAALTMHPAFQKLADGRYDLSNKDANRDQSFIVETEEENKTFTLTVDSETIQWEKESTDNEQPNDFSFLFEEEQ